MDPALTVTNTRPGMSDLQYMLPMYFSEGVRERRLPLTRFVATTPTNAARIFGLYPRKGVIREELTPTSNLGSESPGHRPHCSSRRVQRGLQCVRELEGNGLARNDDSTRRGRLQSMLGDSLVDVGRLSPSQESSGIGDERRSSNSLCFSERTCNVTRFTNARTRRPPRPSPWASSRLCGTWTARTSRSGSSTSTD